MHSAFAEIVDYAGLFPPASCSMADAARQYAGYRRSADRWMLGRFVVAAARLGELGDTIAAESIIIETDDPWRLSVVMSGDGAGELEQIGSFQERWESQGLRADAIECKVSSVAQVHTQGAGIPDSWQRYFEVPAVGPYDAIVAAIARVGAFAKVRTGGTTPALFPAAIELTAFLAAAVRYGVRFKATAGLHHPFRGNYPLTYVSGAERHPMYGFVNLLVATTELVRSGNSVRAQAILEDADVAAFVVNPRGISWRDTVYSAAELTTAHERNFVGFGSCSFREPVDELGLGRAA
jgi:hypothetical protein